ncbi:hypothetical protein B296_00057304 [Ensete ventricosum]|uniref:Uncharacterized protein n=1 Tax=Ensete ventricosum TaxID=4639 RepID=A0A426XRU6_ENSVE|nr:hypothetical protein B296_00057304 [Ensete ventricosum]
MKSPGPHRRRNLRTRLFVFCFVAFVVVLYGEDFTCILGTPFRRADDPPSPPQQGRVPRGSEERREKRPRCELLLQKDEAVVPFAVGKGKTDEGCDVFAGEWVYDELSRPHYGEEECPYIQPQLTCQAHGRPDAGYQHWRWQPHRCSLPSFDATLMLEMLRGKRMMFVGDSLNRGQFVSMVCLLHRVIPEHAKSMETFDSLTVFTAKVSISAGRLPSSLPTSPSALPLTWTTVLMVGLQCDDRVLLGALSGGIQLRQRRRSQDQRPDRPTGRGDTKNVTEMVTEDAYRLALRRMLKWVEKNMDPRSTRVFFTSMSPSHHRWDGCFCSSKEWGGDPEGNCYNETTPIEDATYWGTSTSKSMMQVIGDVFDATGVPITLLNITQLSEYRKDAHTQIYKKQWSPLTPEQLGNPRSYADCIHWCLPGLQDTWNELLYAKLFFP